MDQSMLDAIDRAICGEIWASDAANRNLETLCLECSGRFAGSANDRRAVELVTRLWEQYGLTDVHSEPFPLVAWERGETILEIVSPAQRAYPCVALPYAPACNLEAEAIDLGFGHDDDVDRAGAEVRGKIAVVKSANAPDHRPEHRMEKYIRAKEAGAVAFLFVDGQPGMLPPTGSLAFEQSGPLDQALPSAGIPYEVGLELARWAGRGPVRLRLRMDNRLRRATSENVVGEMPGSTTDERILMISAHMDGHDIAQAALDNGSGVIAVTEIARVLALQSQHLPRTLRFIAFNAEELGMLGAYHYAREHAAELDRIQFLFNLDCVGSGGTLGFNLQNCPELVPAFQALSSPLAVDIAVAEHPVPFSDQFPFTLQGLPSAFIATAGIGGVRGWGHTSADTLDKVDLQSIRMTAATVARLALRLANDLGSWPGRRRSSDEVKSALQKSGLEPLLRVQGVWPF